MRRSGAVFDELMIFCWCQWKIFKKNENKDRNIFDRITINNKNYYRDKDNILFDGDLNIHGIVQILPDSSQKIIIRYRVNRKLYYKKFLQEQDLKMKSLLKNNNLKK